MAVVLIAAGDDPNADVTVVLIAAGDDPDADVDFVVCCLDTVSGMAEAVGSRFEGILRAPVPGVQCTLGDIVLQSCQVNKPT